MSTHESSTDDSSAHDPRPRTSRRTAFVRRPFELLHQGQTNDCGPFATTMALHAFGRFDLSVPVVAQTMRWLRVPGVGATTPRAVRVALHHFRAESSGGWFRQLHDLCTAVDRNLPSLVIVKPTDFHNCPRFALHFRLVVGYDIDESAPGGGRLYFACSSLPPRRLLGDAEVSPANVAVSFADFDRQWRTWATWRWSVAVQVAANETAERSDPPA